MSKQILLDYIDKHKNNKDFKYIPSSFGSLVNLLEEIHRQVIKVHAKVIVELGTDTGSSTVALISGTQDFNGTVYSIDIAPCEVAKKTISELGLEEHWLFSQMDSREACNVWNTEIDLLFIDTDHTYETTMKEMVNWIPWVKEGGVILFHDVISRKDEVQRAIDDYINHIRTKGKFTYSIYAGTDGTDPYGLGIMNKL